MLPESSLSMSITTKTMKKIIAALLLLASLSAVAANTYINPNGSDSNDCLSTALPNPPGSASGACLTLARAISVATGNSLYGNGNVYAAAGQYVANAAGFSHFQMGTISGDCNNPTAVVFNIPINGQGFLAQDHATMWLQCFSTLTFGSGSYVINARQFAIVDYSSITFGYMPGGVHVSAQEMSKVNCTGTNTITGSAIYHVFASGMAMSEMACTMNIQNTPSFTAFYGIGPRSLVNAIATTYTGTGISGASYDVNNGTLMLWGRTMPGSGPGTLQHGYDVQ